MWADLVVGFRGLRRTPAVVVTAVATLGIGIGASAALFSLVHSVLIRPLPFRDPDRLARIGAAAALPPLAEWRARTRIFEDLAVFDPDVEPMVLGVGSASFQVQPTAVSPNLFALLGVRPALGRDLAPAQPGRGPRAGAEIVVSHALWQRAFGGDRAVIGRMVRIEGVPGSIVVGVMPPGFSFPADTELWTAMDVSTAVRLGERGGAIGRLAGSMGLLAARGELEDITGPDSKITVVPLLESVVGDSRRTLLLLLAAVLFLLLVGCANVSNLLLARGIGRRTELAVRIALGGSRLRIARLLLAEAMLLGVGGVLLGALTASAMLPSLVRLAGDSVPRIADARLDGPTLLFLAVAGCLAALVTGLAPALAHRRADVQEALAANGARATRSPADTRVQQVVVAAELAACLVLLVGALLFSRSLLRLQAVDLGFDSKRIVSVDIRVPIHRIATPDRWQRLAEDASAALERVRTLPGVTSAAAASDLPLSREAATTDVTLPGDSVSRPVLYHRVTPGYFETMGMTLIRGRDFTDADVSDLARLPDPRQAVPRPGAVIVNETAARMLWGQDHALGRSLATSFDARPVSRRDVVGVVRDARSTSIRETAPAEIFVPYLEDPAFAMTLLVRSRLPPDSIVPSVRGELQAVSPDFTAANVRTLDDVVAGALRTPRFSALVLSAFGAAAVLLSALGVFGVFAFAAAGRRQEVGIRVALGATRADVARLFLGRAARPIATGILSGIVVAAVLGRSVASLLFGVTPTDPGSYLAAGLLLAAIALGASYWPVRTMLRADLVRSLRN